MKSGKQKLIKFCPHAMKQLDERNISKNLVKKVLRHPGQIISSYGSEKSCPKSYRI